MNNKSCRLCLTPNPNTECLNIFSALGVEMKMVDILCEHFKCDISESDPLPNMVCQMCWSTTEAFHELYQKSKATQEKLLNPLVKMESDDVWPVDANKDLHKESEFVEEINVEVGPIKVEPSSGHSEDSADSGDSDVQAEVDHLDNSNDESSDQNNRDDGADDDEEEEEEDDEDGDEDEDDDDDDDDGKNRKRNRKPTTVKALKRWRTKQKEIKFQKLFEANKHLFDLSCDLCPKIFKSLDEGRAHYLTDHNNSKGYIKCCGAKLQYRCKVVQHLERHLEPEKLKCTKCDHVYSSVRELSMHLKRRHDEKIERRIKDMPCSVCKKMFATQTSLQRHMQRHTAKRGPDDILYDKFISDNFDLTCDRCDAVFTAFHDARLHYKESHNDDKGYIKCCGTKLKALWIIRDHIKSHLNPESFKCEICGKSFTTRMILVQHRRRHRLTMHKSFICDYCGKSCRDKDAITRHLFTNHVKSEPKYECEICHKKFQLPSLLKNHGYSVHREKKPSVTCEICGKSFYVKFHLDKHMLSHTDKSERLAMRKQCEHCGEWLMTKSGIYYHEQIHTTGVQKCKQCEVELPNKLALLAHIRQYHREHKYKCGYCEKTFSTASVMKTHEEGHTRHNVYQCKFCPRVFTVPSSRRTHTRRNHQEELKMSKEIKNSTS